MAVDPERIEQIVRATADLYREAEQQLVRAITRHLTVGLETPQWATERLLAIGKVRAAVAEILDDLRGELPDLVLQAVTEAYESADASVLGEIPEQVAARLQAAVAQPALPRPQVILALATALVRDIGARHSNVLRHVMDVYRRVIAEATAGSTIGGLTRRQAAQIAFARFVEHGVASFVDRRGRRWRLSSYVEMGVRTVTQRAAVQGQVDRQQRLGLDLVMVSNEAQECVLCRPYEGQVLRIDPGPTGRITVPHQLTGEPIQIEVRAVLADARAAGFQHPNCRHSVRAYLPGVTRLPPRPTADPAGDAARQRQRAIERSIRRWRERELGALTPVAAAQARAKVRAWQGQMRKHLAAHPSLKRLPYRETIGAGSQPR
ncbi:phage minor capsid protein [Actinoplanes sp. NPDC051861]|uniref:phage minor capsid protein n=1 Tax=Actinoplanes sp. NPDC051861 TaxID=3155170 RepID=UPI00343B0E39